MIIIKKDNKINSIASSITDLKLQLILNKRLFIIEEIPQVLYEKVEANILSKLYKLEEKFKILNNN